MIIEYSKIRKTNSYFYFYALNHNKLDNLNIEKIKIVKDGNCYFRSLSFFNTGKEKYFSFFRHLLYLYCKNNSLNDKYTDMHTLLNEKFVEINDYIDYIKNNQFYAGDFEISESCKLFKINILKYTKKKKIIV